MRVRHADPDRDAAACAAVYAPYVNPGVASLEERPPEPPEFRERIRIISRDYPWLVAEIDGEVVGYAYASRHRDRASYRWSADVTVYISAAHHRRGVGRALYGALFELLVRQGVYEACAGITLPNASSVGLHESLGFVPIGVYENIAYKFGSWRSTGWWRKTLQPHRDDQPPGRARTPGTTPGRLTGRRQVKGEGRALDEHPTAVGLRDRRHDRQPEAGSPAGGRSPRHARTVRTAGRARRDQARRPHRRR